MTEPILDPNYWKQRLETAPEGNEHHAICICDVDLWNRTAEKTRQVLAEKIQPTDSIIDIGCGMGRLLNLLPKSWQGKYLGIDLSKDFIQEAARLHPGRVFRVCEATDIYAVPDKQFDWAILISIRYMIIKNLGEGYWLKCLTEINRVAKNVMYLEYDEFNPLEGEDYAHLIERSLQQTS